MVCVSRMIIRTAKILLMSGLIGSSFALCAQESASPNLADALPAKQGQYAPEAAIGLQVARVVAGMLGYTYWPLAKNERTLCVAKESRFELSLLQEVPYITSREKWTTQSLVVISSDEVVESCDALYYSADFAKGHKPLLAGVQRKPVMTIIENSDLCDEGSLFCIDARNGRRVTFQANLDAMSLSTLRVNPQVLRMGREAQ